MTEWLRHLNPLGLSSFILIPQLIVQFFINIFYKSLRNNKFSRVLPFAELSLTLLCQNKKSSILNDMAKIAIKYDNIVP